MTTHFEEVQKYQKERYKRIFLSACQVLSLARQIRNYAETHICGLNLTGIDEAEKMPSIVYKKLPHAVLELQDAFNRE